MALDWYLVEPDSYREFLAHRRRWFRRRNVVGGTGNHVALDEDAHQALLSRCGHLRLLRRAADYYEDAAYAPDEVAVLLDELQTAGGSAAAVELAALCQEALQRQCGIIAVAD